MSQVSLRSVDPENYGAVIDLAVSPQQEAYVANNTKSIADAYVYREAAQPLAVYDDDTPIGFVLLYPMLEDRQLHHPWPMDAAIEGVFLVRMMVDARFQSRGLGRATLAAVVDHARTHPATYFVRLSVIPDNPARDFYRRFGFIETGDVVDDEIVMELAL